MKLKLFYLIILLTAIMPFSTIPVHANIVQDGFNNQLPGLVEPPYSFYSSNTTVISGRVESMPNYASYPPNVFVFNVTSAGTATASLTLPFIALQASMPVRIGLYLYGNKSAITRSEATISFIENGQVQYSYPVSNMNNSVIHVVEGAIYANPSSTGNFTIQLSVSKAPTFALILEYIQVDDADIYLTPYNVELINALNGLPYSVSAPFPTLIAEYPFAISAASTQQQLGSNATSTTMYTAYAYVAPGAYLYQLKINNYTITQIPSVSPDIYIFPSNTLPVTLTITDLTSLFAPGSEVIIYYAGFPISSGYLSSSYVYSFYAPPGTYTLKIIGTDGATYTQTLSITASSYEQSIVIQKILVSAPGNGQIPVYGAGFSQNRSSVIAYFIDPTGATTNVTAYLIEENATGYETVASASAASSFLYAVFPANSSQNYVMKFVAYSPSGTAIYGPIAVSGQAVFLAVPQLPTSFLGLNYIFPTPYGWVNLLAAFVMVITAVLFGARYSKIAILAVSLEGIAFSVSGWVSIPVAIFMVFGALAIIWLMIEKSQDTL